MPAVETSGRWSSRRRACVSGVRTQLPCEARRGSRSNPRPYIKYPLTHPTGATWCPWPPVCRPLWDVSQFVCSWLLPPSPPPMKYTPSCCRLLPCKTSRRFFTKPPSTEKERTANTPRARTHTHIHHPKHRWFPTHVGRIVNYLHLCLTYWYLNTILCEIIFTATATF